MAAIADIVKSLTSAQRDIVALVEGILIELRDDADNAGSTDLELYTLAREIAMMRMQVALAD